MRIWNYCFPHRTGKTPKIAKLPDTGTSNLPVVIISVPLTSMKLVCALRMWVEFPLWSVVFLQGLCNNPWPYLLPSRILHQRLQTFHTARPWILPTPVFFSFALHLTTSTKQKQSMVESDPKITFSGHCVWFRRDIRKLINMLIIR